MADMIRERVAELVEPVTKTHKKLLGIINDKILYRIDKIFAENDIRKHEISDIKKEVIKINKVETE